jgi:hypothetical protein
MSYFDYSVVLKNLPHSQKKCAGIFASRVVGNGKRGNGFLQLPRFPLPMTNILSQRLGAANNL